jgi:hypothetical protein
MIHMLLVQKLTPNSDVNGMVKEGLLRLSHFSVLLQFSHKIPSQLYLNGQRHFQSDNIYNLIKLLLAMLN